MHVPKRAKRRGWWVALLALAALLAPNAHTLAEGARYLTQWLTWDPAAGQRIAPGGAFGLIYPLVEQDNANRAQTIVARLRALGIEPTLISVPGQATPNILVTLGGDGPYTLYLAHYDKSRETPAYQGAADNTAAVAVLLAVAERLAPRSDLRPTALLWTVAEEQGLLGARAFIAWASTTGVGIAEAINLDMLGRGKLAARPPGWPGLYLYLPGVGHLVFDGRSLARADASTQPDPALVRRTQAAAESSLTVYRRFAAHGDAIPLEQAGIPTLTLSSADMYYLDRVWERDSDRIELLDERHLESAAALLVRLAAP